MSRQFVIRVPDDVGRAIEEAAEEKGLNYTDIIRSSIEEYLQLAPKGVLGKIGDAVESGFARMQRQKKCPHPPSRRIYFNGNMVCDECNKTL